MKRFKIRTGITSGRKGRSWTASERKRNEERKDQPKWQGEICHRPGTQAMTGRIQDLLATEARHRLSGTHTPDIRPMREWIEVPHLGKPKMVEIDIINIDTRSIQLRNVTPLPGRSRTGGTGTLTEEVGTLPDTTIQESWRAAVGGTKKSYSDFLSPLRGVWKVQGVPQVRRVPSSILLYIHPPRYHGFLYQFRHKNYEDMKYDHDMKIGKITHKDNQDTSTTRRLKSTEVLLSRHGRFRPQLALRRTNRSATAGLLGNPTKRRRRQSPLVPNSLGSTTRCIRA